VDGEPQALVVSTSPSLPPHMMIPEHSPALSKQAAARKIGYSISA
jgi:hypothetical protein